MMATESPVEFKLPATAKVLFNELYADMPAECLRPDLVAVQLATGRWIDVSWLPMFDPAGGYHVTVFPDSTFEALIVATLVKTPDEVVEVVNDYAEVYG